MKKIVSMILTGVMSVSLVACSSSSTTVTSNTGPSETEETNPTVTSDTSPVEMKVAMVTDYGDITDQSFNQTTYEASKAFCEAAGYDFIYKKPATDSDADRAAAMEAAISEGYNVIVMPGYAFAQAIVDVAPLYPDVKFVALDVAESDFEGANGGANADLSNVYSAIYQEELAGYMAGYAAVAMGYTKLGFLGGMAVPSVIRYGYGFVQGANDAAEILGIPGVEVNYVYGGQFYGDADITARMDTWYAAGTEVVFACGGGIYTSAAEAAAKYDGHVIGVDVDQAPTIDATYGAGMTITSAMKGLAATVNTLLSAIEAGEWDEYAGKIETLGLVSTEPTENYVQLGESTVYNDTFTEADYIELVKKLYDGDLTVDNTSEADLATSFGKVITVKDEGSIKG